MHTFKKYYCGLALIAAILFIGIPHADAARITQSGFELDSATNGVEFGTNNGTPVMQTTNCRTGTYCMKISSMTSATAMNVRFSFATLGSGGNGPYFARTYFMYTTLPTAENRIYEFRDGNAGVAKSYLTIDSSGLLRLYNSAGTQIGSASSALTNGQWYRLEMRIDRTPAAGSQVIEAKIDGTVFATASNQTIATNAGDMMRVGGNLNSEAQTTGVWYFDDMAVNDSTGSSQTSYPGDGKIIHLLPNAAGDVNGFATQTGGTAGSTNNFTRVNEVPPNDATSFNGDNIGIGDADMFNVTNSGINSYDIVNVVQIGGRIRNNTADATTALKFQIEKTAAGTIAQSAATIPNTTSFRTNGSSTVFQPFITEYKDPDGTNAWTQATLDTMQIGYDISALGVNRIDVTSVWASVDYSVGTAPSTPDFGLVVLFGDW